jgi:lipoic acid synthetase
MEQVLETMHDLRAAQVDLLAIGQYLRPTDKKRHYPLVEYVHPENFKLLKEEGMKMGFTFIASGPLVRTSYKAFEAAMWFGREATRSGAN